MKTNKFEKIATYTHEGGKSSPTSPFQKLKRLCMATMLWEDTFYVDGKNSTDIISETCNLVSTPKIVDLAIECHEKGLLRHMPLYLIVEAIKSRKCCPDLKDAIYKICNRPDQMTELLSLYWKNGKIPLASQLKKGLAKAFGRFDEYQLAKYNRDSPIKLRDILFLCHAKPKDQKQDELWKRLISNTLATPDTWETKLSSGENKKESFQELLERGKMGKLAIVRNLRNMCESGVPKDLVARELMRNSRPLLPFQFLAAAKAVPQWESLIDQAMIKAMEGKDKLAGKTIVLVDVSSSMNDKISGKGEISRMDAACGLAILLREICNEVTFYTFSNVIAIIPDRHGMALRDAINNSQPHLGTYLGAALNYLSYHDTTNRIIVITDEQTRDAVPVMKIKNCYILNIGGYQNGILNHGQWLTVSGFSENSIDYILEIEKENEE